MEVRKTVTVLFADVTGSTALGEHLDPESMRGVMSRYFDEMRSAIEAHGGTVEKFIGDAEILERISDYGHLASSAPDLGDAVHAQGRHDEAFDISVFTEGITIEGYMDLW